ncbi:MAG TPA: hypothetical protein VGI00_11295 [Streptosporangiaceae bacterium]|jgi:hypothetical protein
MKVTLSAAMRARDVSRPRPEDEEAAKEAASQPPAGNTRPRPDRTGGGSREGGSRDGGGRDGGGRAAGGKNAGGGRRRKRR